MLSACINPPQPLEPQRGLERADETNGHLIRSFYTGSYALLIGESKYNNGWSNLEAIPGELQQVENLLTAKCFHVERSMNLKADALGKRIETFINDYGFDENNRLLFFYSGHGHTRKDKDKGYLVPTDAPNPYFDEKGFLQKALSMNQILTWARRIEAKHALFVFDSCFSGTVFKGKEPEMPRQISQAAKLPVRQFITAGSADETVPAKSVFTPAFIDALRFGWGDLYKDGYVTGEELGLYLKNKVPQHANQTPQYGKIKDYDLSRGDFVFLVGNGCPVPPPVQPQVPPDVPVPVPKPVVSIPSRYTNNGDGTVTDNKTGLIWLKNANCFSWVEGTDAKKLVDKLAHGQCGLSDGSKPSAWRLPTRKEWEAMKTGIKGDVFSDVQARYWLSDTSAEVKIFRQKTTLSVTNVCTSDNTYCYVWPVRRRQ
jgi:hypothetical protein